MENLLKPIYDNEREGKKGPVFFIFPGKGINHHIFFYFFVDDLVIISKQLGYPFLLLRGRNLLFQKILEALMINFNLEALSQEIRTSDIHGMHNSQHFLFIGGLAQMELEQLFVGESQRLTILHEDNHNAFPLGITF
jgi:hypothetical protein